MKALIAAYARSPQHFARKGPLAAVRPDSMAAQVVTGLLNRTKLDPALIEDVIVGCAYPEGPQGSNIARIIVLLAGLPLEVGGMTVNRFCGSSMSAIQIAAAQIEAGIGEAYLCVGVESMSMVPQGGFNRSPNPELSSRFPDAYISMGQTAENVARKYNISRRDQEVLAVESHQKAAEAREQGRLHEEIVPIQLESGELVTEDGCIRPATSLEALAALKPVFAADGVVTAGTSSPLTDGASVVLVTSEEFAARRGLHPLARLRSAATVGCDPAVMGIGPIPATRKALARAGLDVAALDVIEINEAFASQALACLRQLGLPDDAEHVNPHGGAIALGHPLGMSGARLVLTAVHGLEKRGGKRALATMCVGVGQGVSLAIERI
jgi:acetyl-CoA acyltransferase